MTTTRLPLVAAPTPGIVERLRQRLADYDADLAQTIAAKILPDRAAYGEDVSGITYAEISEAAALIEKQGALLRDLVAAWDNYVDICSDANRYGERIEASAAIMRAARAAKTLGERE